jgi:hypothetical protein
MLYMLSLLLLLPGRKNPRDRHEKWRNCFVFVQCTVLSSARKRIALGCLVDKVRVREGCPVLCALTYGPDFATRDMVLWL